MRIFLSLLALVLASVAAEAAPRPLIASGWLEFREARLRVLIETPMPGDGMMRGGIEIAMADGYKTYWRSPGDSGVPPRFDAGGSEGLTDFRAEFPFPRGFDDGAGGIAWGYKHRVILPLNARRVEGAPLRLALKIEFAVCGTMCIPLSGEVMLDPVNAASAGPEAAEQLAAALSRVPKVLAEAAARERLAVSRIAGDKPRWRLALSDPLDPASAAIFPEANGYFSPGQPQRLPDGRLAVEIAGEAAPGSGGKFGSVRLTFGDHTRAFEAIIDLDGATQAP